jgi:hypothetical protein
MKDYILTNDLKNELIKQLLNAKIESVGQSINNQTLIGKLQSLPEVSV